MIIKSLKIALICIGSISIMLASGCDGNDDENPNPNQNVNEKPEPPAVTKYTVSVSKGEYGSALATIDGENVTEAGEGTLITLSATPDPDYRFVEWIVESENTTLANRSTTEFTMPAGDVSFKPVFDPVRYYRISLNSRIPASFVSVKVTIAGLEATKARAGDEVTLTATTEEGYGLNYWMIDNTDNEVAVDDILDYNTGTTTTFLMPEYPIMVNCAITKNAYWVRVENDGNGHATVGMLANQNAFYWGSNVEIVPIPNAGYKFKEWTEIVGIDGVDPKANPLKIVTPKGEVTMKATFEVE
jgi:hypothetical protein